MGVVAPILLVGSEHALANSSGVRYAKLLWGRSSLYSIRHRSIFCLASASVVNLMIQTLIAESPVEALDMPVLHGPARLNVQQCDLPFLAPDQEVPARELRPVIASNH